MVFLYSGVSLSCSSCFCSGGNVVRLLSCSAVRLQESDVKPVETKSQSAPVKRLKEYVLYTNTDSHLCTCTFAYRHFLTHWFPNFLQLNHKIIYCENLNSFWFRGRYWYCDANKYDMYCRSMAIFLWCDVCLVQLVKLPRRDLILTLRLSWVLFSAIYLFNVHIQKSSMKPWMLLIHQQVVNLLLVF